MSGRETKWPRSGPRSGAECLPGLVPLQLCLAYSLKETPRLRPGNLAMLGCWLVDLGAENLSRWYSHRAN